MSKGERIVTNEGSHTGWELDSSWKVGMPWEGLKGEHFRGVGTAGDGGLEVRTAGWGGRYCSSDLGIFGKGGSGCL